MTVGQALSMDRDALPADFEGASWCENYDYRCQAAARTWQRPHAMDNLM